MLNLVVLIATLWPVQQPASTATLPGDVPFVQQQTAGDDAPDKAGSKPTEQTPAKQSPDKPADAQDKQEAGQDKQEDAEEGARPAAPKPVHLKAYAITLGAADWDLRGNENKFRQYGTPPRGIFARELLFAPKPSLRDTGFISLRGPGETDYRHDGRIALFYGRTQGELSFWRNEFYDPTIFVIPGSHRNVNEESIKQFLGRDFSLSTRYRMIEQDQIFEAPRDQLHQRTRYWDLIGAGRLGEGQIKLGYTNWRYFDRTLTLFDTTVDGMRLGYMWTPTQDIGVEGTYQNLDVTQSGQPKGNIQIMSLTGDSTIGGSTDLGFILRDDRLNLPVIQTAYAREQRLGQLSLAHNWGKWNTRFAISQREVERVRADQSFVDVPEWFTFEGRLDGRVTQDLRLTVRGYTQSASHLPPMSTVDPRSLYWSSRDFVQVRLQHGRRDLGGYFAWTYRNWDNEARAVNVNLNSFVVGGNWQATPKLSLFAEYTREDWSGKSTENTVFPTLQMFLPDSYVLAAGLDYLVNSRAYLSLNVSNFDTNNDNPLLLRDGNTNGLFFTINARYLLNGGNEVGLVIAPWAYHDEVVGQMNYDTAVVMLTGKLRF